MLRLLASSGVFNEVSPGTFRQTPASDTLRLPRVLRLELELPRVLETGRSGIELAFGQLGPTTVPYCEGEELSRWLCRSARPVHTLVGGVTLVVHARDLERHKQCG